MFTKTKSALTGWSELSTRSAEAETILREVIRVNPADAYAHSGLGAAFSA